MSDLKVEPISSSTPVSPDMSGGSRQYDKQKQEQKKEFEDTLAAVYTSSSGREWEMGDDEVLRERIKGKTQ